MSSIHESEKVINDQSKKPSVHLTCIKCKWWPWNVFAFILETSISNAKMILQDNRIKMSNFELTYTIGKALVLPEVRRKYKNSNGMQIKIINETISWYQGGTGRPELDNFLANTGNFKCVESIVGTVYYNIKQKSWTTSWRRNDWSVWSLFGSSTTSRLNSFVQIAKSETISIHCIHVLDLLA